MIFSKAARAEIREHDRSWIVKLCFRLLLVISNIVGIGLVAWYTAVAPKYSQNPYEWFGESGGLWFSLFPMGVSTIYALVTTAYLAVKRRPVHPGWNVGADLLLVLGFITVLIFATVGAIGNLLNSNYETPYDYYEFRTDYNLNQCDQFVNESSSSGNGNGNGGYGYGYTYPYSLSGSCHLPYANGNGSTVLVTTQNIGSCPIFDSCAQQAAFLSGLKSWAIIGVVGMAFIYVGGVIHFILSIWSCVDCSRYNQRNKVDTRARAIAQQMISELRATGELPPVRQPLLAADGAAVATAEDPQTPGYRDDERGDLGVAGTSSSRHQQYFGDEEMSGGGVGRSQGFTSPSTAQLPPMAEADSSAADPSGSGKGKGKWFR